MLEAEEGQVATPDPIVAAETTPTPFVNGDGTFVGNWTNGLEEDVKSEKGLGLFKNVKDLAKSYVNARRMIGKDKIAVPNEKSTPAEWEEFYKAGGRPETSADYKLDYPKDMPTPEVPELRKAWIDAAHKMGYSKKQAAGAYEFYNSLVKQAVLQQQQTEELAQKEANENLHTVWGKAYEQRIHYGNVAIEQGTAGNEELKEKVIEKFGNDPDFIQFVSNLGDKFAEHKTISPNIPTPGDLMTRINDLMHSDAYINASNPGHKAAVELVQKLFVEKNANQKG